MMSKDESNTSSPDQISPNSRRSPNSRKGLNRRKSSVRSLNPNSFLQAHPFLQLYTTIIEDEPQEEITADMLYRKDSVKGETVNYFVESVGGFGKF